MKKLLIFCLFMLVSVSAKLTAQIDTSWNSGSENEKLEKIFKILSSYSLPADRQIYLSLRAREIAIDLNDEKAICLSYKYLGNGYFARSDYDNAIKLYTTTLNLASKLNDLSIISDCNYNLSFVYEGMGNYPEALKYSKKAFEMDYKRGDSAAMAESYNSIGIIYQKMGDYERALSYYLKSLQILENKNDSNGIAQRYNNVGTIFLNLANYKKAFEYLSASLNMFSKLNNLPEKCKTMISLGDYYQRNGKSDSSMLFFRQVLDLTDVLGDYKLKANILLRLGDMSLLKNDYNDALVKYNQSSELKLNSKDFEGVVRAYSNIANVNMIMGNTDKAMKYLKDALAYHNKVKSKVLLLDIYKLYYTIYKSKNDINKALEYYELYTDLKDSVFAENNNQKIYELQTIYETEKKEKENEILKQSNRIQVLELSRANTTRNMVFIIAALILVLTLILYSRYRAKLKTNHILKENNKILKNQKDQISKQKIEIETINKHITDSIEYANLIQQSMLPNKQLLSGFFSDSFLIFRPRNIVSGDFYWFYEVHNKLAVVVADCTGHGVPGAFMSMLGIEILSEIFEHQNITEPDVVLNQLRKSIRNVLKQEKTGNLDGMDIAICLFDKENQTIEYAGSRMPMVYVENGQLKEIKPNRFSIGGQPNSNEPFQKHIVNYKKPISVYLFSDGFQDQFGGPHNAKVSSALFRELLFIHSEKSLSGQESFLLDFLDKWKGNEFQIDDILIIGMKID